MENLAPVGEKVQLAGAAVYRKRLRARFGRHWDLLAVLLLGFASMPPAWMSPRTLVIVWDPGLVDDSWILDTSFKAWRGLWLGRNVTFTYGPLFQWLSSAPARWMGPSMGAIHATWSTLPLWGTFLFGYLTLHLLLPEQPAWKRFLLLMLLAIFWSPAELRTSYAIFLFALFLRGWYAVRQQRLRPKVLGCGAAFLCAAAFLYSADTGVYAIAAWLVSLAGVTCEGGSGTRSLWRYACVLLSFTGVSLVLLLAINALMAAPLDFRFWKNSLAITSAYRWIEPSMMSKAGKVHLLATWIAGGGVFLLRRVVPGNAAVAARSGFLLGAFVFAVFAMQIGLVRSDLPHILVATFPMVFLAGTVLFSLGSRTDSGVSVLAALAAIAASILLAQAAPMFQASNIRYRYAQMRHPLTACPDGLAEFDRACYPEIFTEMLQTGAGYLQQSSAPHDSIVVFPYQTIFGIASHRDVAGGVLQSYLVSGDYLSGVDIAGLEQAAAPGGLYLPDGEYSDPIDGVANLTRSPQVWLWMFRHYRSEHEVLQGIFGLRRDDLRAARIAIQLEPLNIAERSYPVRTRSSAVDLGATTWPIVGGDALCLRLTVHYGLWWKLRKPARLVLEIERADSSYERKPFIVEPNVSSEVWFYPWDDAELAHYFDADEKHWRTGPRSPITHLRLLVMPLDWVSVQPDTIVIHSAHAARLSLAP